MTLIVVAWLLALLAPLTSRAAVLNEPTPSPLDSLGVLLHSGTIRVISIDEERSNTGPWRFLPPGAHRVIVGFSAIREARAFLDAGEYERLESEHPDTLDVYVQAGHNHRIDATVFEVKDLKGKKRLAWKPKVEDVTGHYFFLLDRSHPDSGITMAAVGKGAKVIVRDVAAGKVGEWVTADSTFVWRGTDHKGRPVKAGLYFYRVSRPDQTEEDGNIVVRE